MAPQDMFIDEEDELCPLCIEEFDLQDKFFKPCPCGYQICQFCFNNIKTNHNGWCPACRRPYDESTIEFRAPTQQEVTEFEARKANNNKKRVVDQRQKEAQKRDVEKDSRKNLVGVRVVQKNLVYVTGLTPTVREDELLKTLRKPEFFGQYGPIQKISISNRKSTDGHNQSLGIYVTFEKKEDAAKCIQAVNGSQNGDRILRAQLGTTKYCSAWLRYEQCNNRQCMFLHELGEEEDSYTRQDLSTLNSLNTQRPLSNPNAGASTSRSASRQQVHAAPPQPAAQPMARSSSKEGSENDDGPALPSTANWARNPPIRSRRGSHATSGAAPSPAVTSALPAMAESAAQEPAEAPIAEETTAASTEETITPAFLEQVKLTPAAIALSNMLKSMALGTIAFPSIPSEESFPPLFDARGGEKRRRAPRQEVHSPPTFPATAHDGTETKDESEGEPETGGSRALGGEPEERDLGREDFSSRRGSQAPIQRGTNDGLFGPVLNSFGQGSTAISSIGSRTMTPQQQNMLRAQGAFVDHLPPGIAASQSNLFQGQGHNRQGSRFSFANDNRDAATAVKLSANPRIMAQQSSMMPAFHNQPGGQYYASSSSSMPGPPPGLKSTSTPPNMFGLGSFPGMNKESELYSLLNRGRGAGASAAQVHDAGKLDLADPSILQARMQHQQQSNAGVGQGLFGGQSQGGYNNQAMMYGSGYNRGW